MYHLNTNRFCKSIRERRFLFNFTAGQLSDFCWTHVLLDLMDLWNKEGLLHKYFASVHSLHHPDAMSALIFKCVFEKLTLNNIPETIIHETDGQ